MREGIEVPTIRLVDYDAVSVKGLPCELVEGGFSSVDWKCY
jgi:hypothetical protein